ncbi:MAG: DNA-directed RNA polymerase subunit omega [Lachnospira sp.]
MLHPSYTELMAVVNSEVEEGEQPLVQSRYSIVKATAARAREIVDARTVEEKKKKMHQEQTTSKEKDKDKDKTEAKKLTKDEERKLAIGQPLISNSDNMKPLSIAVQELYEGKIKIIGNGDDSLNM